MTFPEMRATLRTNEDFKNKTHDDYVLPNLTTEIGLVKQIPLDLICLGVVKRSLLLEGINYCSEIAGNSGISTYFYSLVFQNIEVNYYILKDGTILVPQFLKREPYFTTPSLSSLLNIYVASC